MSLSFVYAGIDVSKATLAVFIPDWGYKQFKNSDSGIQQLLQVALARPNLVLCCEASGGEWSAGGGAKMKRGGGRRVNRTLPVR